MSAVNRSKSFREWQLLNEKITEHAHSRHFKCRCSWGATMWDSIFYFHLRKLRVKSLGVFCGVSLVFLDFILLLTFWNLLIMLNCWQILVLILKLDLGVPFHFIELVGLLMINLCSHSHSVFILRFIHHQTTITVTVGKTNNIGEIRALGNLTYWKSNRIICYAFLFDFW